MLAVDGEGCLTFDVFVGFSRGICPLQETEHQSREVSGVSQQLDT